MTPMSQVLVKDSHLTDRRTLRSAEHGHNYDLGFDDFGIIEGPDEPLLRERPRIQSKRPSMWNVIFHNDDFTEFDFVTDVLLRIFHQPLIDALLITNEVHTRGKAIAGTFTFEIAREKQDEVLRLARNAEFPLLVQLERV
jgi:ATP-dependent Clp protease adaptor protein ClpS